MLKHNEVNPLAVHGLRKLEHCPKHFTCVEFEIRTREKVILDWIWANLEGRFYIGDRYYLSETGALNAHKCVGFELPSEASFFSLILNTINTNDFLF